MIDRPPVRLLIVDDHPIVRAGIKNALFGLPDIAIAGEVVDGKAALAAIDGGGVDVMLLDLAMPGMDGLSVLAALAGSAVKVVVLTSSQDPEALAAAIDAGATSVLMKNVGADTLASTIRKAAHGERYWDPGVSELVMQSLKRKAKKNSNPFADLTSREREVALRIARGLSNAEIGKDLGMSTKTAKVHVSAILSKTGLADRTKIAVLAWESGLAGEDVSKGSQA